MTPTPSCESSVYNHLEALKPVLAGVPGACAEFGCYEGGNTCRIMMAFGRPTYGFDTFDGMPDDGYDAQLDSWNPPGKWKPRINAVKLMQDIGLYPVIGKFSDTIPVFDREHPDIRFTFVHIDCDHYNSYKQVLAYITPRMSPGGIVIMDDYECAGAKKAVDEWMGERTWAKANWRGVQF